MDYLKPKIKKLGREKIATMTSEEIMAKLPGYTESAYYNILRDLKWDFKRRRTRKK